MATIQEKRENLRGDSEYGLLKFIYRVMDDFFLDPILGFFIPGAGDIITSALTIPFVWTSIFKLRSFPLTLAIIYNALVDTLIGLFPFVGDFIDIFKKSYKKNYKLIVGYVENDSGVISEVNSSALKTCVFITILCFVIRFVAMLFAGIYNWIAGLF